MKKLAPRAWYSKIETHFLKVVFHKCPYECILVKIEKENISIVCLYLDDLVFTGNNTPQEKVKLPTKLYQSVKYHYC